MIKTIEDAIKAIDNEIAQNPMAKTSLPDIRAMFYGAQSTIQVQRDQLHGRNMQIKELKKEVSHLSDIVEGFGINPKTEERDFDLG